MYLTRPLVENMNWRILCSRFYTFYTDICLCGCAFVCSLSIQSCTYRRLINHQISADSSTKWVVTVDDYILLFHYIDFIMSALPSQITCVSIVCSAVCLGADQINHQSSASLAFVRGIHRRPVDSPHKGPVARKRFPFDYNENLGIDTKLDFRSGMVPKLLDI